VSFGFCVWPAAKTGFFGAVAGSFVLEAADRQLETFDHRVGVGEVAAVLMILRGWSFSDWVAFDPKAQTPHWTINTPQPDMVRPQSIPRTPSNGSPISCRFACGF
jgi:hypothetical protein